MEGVGWGNFVHIELYMTILYRFVKKKSKWSDDPPQLKTHWAPNQLPQGNLLIGVARSDKISGFRARSRAKSRSHCVPGVDIGLWAAPLHCSGRNTLPTPVGDDVADRWWM